MTNKWFVVGYDKVSERFTEEFQIDERLLSDFRQLLQKQASDPLIMAYQLPRSRRAWLEERVRGHLDFDRNDYFLQCYAE